MSSPSSPLTTPPVTPAARAAVEAAAPAGLSPGVVAGIVAAEVDGHKWRQGQRSWSGGSNGEAEGAVLTLRADG